MCSIVFLANRTADSVGKSDFDELVSLQDSINAKFAQSARVIAMHADPKMWSETGIAGANGNVKATDNYYEGGTKPEYITWEAQIDPANADMKENLYAFCFVAEMSPAGLGIQAGGIPESARKLRLSLTKDLSRVDRKKLVVQPAIARVLEIAQRLDQTTPLLRSYAVGDIGVHMRDGLPVDEVDQATAAMNWRSAQLMSIEDGVAMRVEDPDAAKLEVQRIKDEEAAKVPTVFGGPGAPGALGAADGNDAENAADQSIDSRKTQQQEAA
jgi:hypothetical protein